AAAAHAKGAFVGCDNTWATPLLFKPLDHGADFAMEALTKYVGGHSDILLGSITVREVALHRRLKDTTRMLGIGVSPDECQLAIRGLQTMGVRLAHVGHVAEALAQRIVGQPGVDRVLHPALPTCPGHEIWRRDFSGASGLFSVVMKPGVEHRLDAALSAMKTFAIGASWGGVRSLIVPMDIRSDRVAVPWREEGPILRISIGLEDPQDLWDDLSRLFAHVGSDLAEPGS
ncbi:MAG: PLP-dependent transferase, partial [Alphaproteobacteria bacterium]|nr:PLP-dependent transferase [Alphaproteobacteria bacterium]